VLNVIIAPMCYNCSITLIVVPAVSHCISNKGSPQGKIIALILNNIAYNSFHFYTVVMILADRNNVHLKKDLH